MKLLRPSVTINFTKMKEVNVSQLGDYDAPICEQQYTNESCYISLFKFKSFDQFNTPQTASKFRHLLNCGTIVGMLILFTNISKFHHDSPQFLQHPIKFAIVDPSTASHCTTKLTIKATGRIFLGARSKHALELQND